MTTGCFVRLCIACEQAPHLGKAREVTREKHAKGDPSRLSSLAIHGEVASRLGYAIILFCETFTHFHCSLLERATHNVASHADVLLARQAILPNVRGAGTRDELVRKSAWKATYITGPKYLCIFFFKSFLHE